MLSLGGRHVLGADGKADDEQRQEAQARESDQGDGGRRGEVRGVGDAAVPDQTQDDAEERHQQSADVDAGLDLRTPRRRRVVDAERRIE